MGVGKNIKLQGTLYTPVSVLGEQLRRGRVGPVLRGWDEHHAHVQGTARD